VGEDWRDLETRIKLPLLRQNSHQKERTNMIRGLAKLRLLLPLAALLSTGCIVAARPRVPCPGAVWIEGHYDRFQHWHPAHWRCPGVVEEEVIIR
jgi:hypothetical protein